MHLALVGEIECPLAGRLFVEPVEVAQKRNEVQSLFPGKGYHPLLAFD